MTTNQERDTPKRRSLVLIDVTPSSSSSVAAYNRFRRPAPFLYSEAQLGALLAAAEQLRPQIRAVTFRTLLSLQAATGIRTGEAIDLDSSDLDTDQGTLTVTGKYGKTRLLPLHRTVTEGLTGYLDTRRQLLPRRALPCVADLDTWNPARPWQHPPHVPGGRGTGRADRQLVGEPATAT